MLTLTDLETAHARKTTAALNRCVEICTDGEKGFGAAAADVRNTTLKAIFRLYESQRADFVRSLQAEIDALGYTHENQGTVRGTLHRAWTGARLQLEGRNDEVIVDECMRGEIAALRVYDQLLLHADTFLDRTRVLLVRQREAIAGALEEMKTRLAFPPKAP